MDYLTNSDHFTVSSWIREELLQCILSNDTITTAYLKILNDEAQNYDVFALISQTKKRHLAQLSSALLLDPIVKLWIPECLR